MSRVLVRDLMTEDPYTLEPTHTLADLNDLMDDKRVRHVPIVDAAGRLHGLVTHRDLLRGALHSDKELPISTRRHMLDTFKIDEIMTREPETTEPDEKIAVAGALMIELKFGCLLVVEDEALVGILTEADFVRYVVETTG